MLAMARELDQFCWAKLIVLVMSHHYFRAVIVEWEITTVITVETLALDVEILEVKIIDERLFPVYTNSLEECFIVTIKVNQP